MEFVFAAMGWASALLAMEQEKWTIIAALPAKAPAGAIGAMAAVCAAAVTAPEKTSDIKQK